MSKPRTTPRRVVSSIVYDGTCDDENLRALPPAARAALRSPRCTPMPSSRLRSPDRQRALACFARLSACEETSGRIDRQEDGAAGNGQENRRAVRICFTDRSSLIGKTRDRSDAEMLGGIVLWDRRTSEACRLRSSANRRLMRRAEDNSIAHLNGVVT